MLHKEGNRPKVFLLLRGAERGHARVADAVLAKTGSEASAIRIANAKYIQPTEDERITLVTCWPYTNNTHRLIIVARPLNQNKGRGME